MTTTVVLITGHPATGKTTLAHTIAPSLGLPLLGRDEGKETLWEELPSPPDVDPKTWSRQLSRISWLLFYQQIETLLRAEISHIAESNFDPRYADAHWQRLAARYPLQLVQVRCETAPETVLNRYRARIETGERHAAHVDDGMNPAFVAQIWRGPLGWVGVAGPRLAVDTTSLTATDYEALVARIAVHLER